VRDEVTHRLRGLDSRHPVQSLRERCAMAACACPDVDQRAIWPQPGLEPVQEPVLLGAHREGEAASSTSPPVPLMIPTADLRLPRVDQTPPVRCPVDVKHCVHRPYLALAREQGAAAVPVSSVRRILVTDAFQSEPWGGRLCYRSSACATSSRW